MMDTLPIFKDIVVKGLVAKAVGYNSKAMVIEKEIGLESIFTLLANGESEVEIASNLNLSPEELKYILTRNQEARKSYLNSKMFAMGSISVDTLHSRFNGVDELDTVQNNAAKFHLAVVENVSKILNTTNKDNNTNVVVNNNITYESSKSIPALPEGIDDIVDAEIVDNGSYDELTNY